MELLERYNKGAKMNCWESLLIYAFQKRGILIEEQKVHDFNPLYALANVTGQYQDHST
jgi:hypothetical protein